jgi:Gpi18-like mannosyltransferase
MISSDISIIGSYFILKFNFRIGGLHMGRFIQYSGSILILAVLLFVIYRIAIELGFISKNFTKNPKVASFINISALVFIVQSAVLATGFIIFNAVHGKTNFFELEKIRLRGDSKTMVDLAGNCLTANACPQGSPTLYPVFLKIAAIPFYNFYLLAGMVLSGLAVIIACYFLYQLVKLDYSELSAKNTLTFLLFFPFTFSLFLPVPESLFLAFSIAAFYMMRKQKWFMVAIWSFLAVLCDLRGILLILPAIYEIFQQNRKRWQIVFPILFVAFGCMAILAFNQFQSGNPLAFLNHFSANFNFLNHVWNADIRIFYANVLPLLVLIIGVILGGFYALDKLRPSYLLYMVPLSAVAFFIPWLENQPRFFVTVFPLFMGLGLFVKNRTANIILLFLFTILMGFYLFCNIFFKMSF